MRAIVNVVLYSILDRDTRWEGRY